MLEGSILQKLNTAHLKNRVALNFGVYYKNTLVALCHALEDFILSSDSAPIMITAFQRGKWYLQEADRYGEIAQKAAQIAIMAAPDGGFDTHPTSNLPNVALVNLSPEDPVGQEWHLMILSPTYTAMVLCQELSPEDYGIDRQPNNDLERKFYGFWTFEPELVKETVELAIEHIQTYDRQLAQNLSDRVAQMTAEYGTRQREDLDRVVSLVVEYLQNSQQTLHDRDNDSTFLQALDDNILSNEMQALMRMAQIIDYTDVRNPMAAAEVAALTEAMAQLLDLPAWQVKRLSLASLLHRLGYLSSNPSEDLKSIAQKQALATETSLPRSSALRIMPQLSAIAKIITHQTETWDGTGVPAGLAYDAIPLESRIIRLVADFQQKMTVYHQEIPKERVFSQALSDCQAQAGIIYDPKLVEALSLLVMGMQQGMSISVDRPKITSGMWQIDREIIE
jgi:DICT domain-containing protein